MYRVLSSSSLGYQLFNDDDRSLSLHQRRGKVLYHNQGILVGDHVTLDRDGYIIGIEERKNELARPHLANSDEMLVLMSLREPDFSSYLLDKFLSATHFHRIPSAIVLTKKDLLDDTGIRAIRERMAFYEKLGYPVYLLSLRDKDDSELLKLKADIRGKAVSLMGQTGVGKSSLINALFPGFNRKVDSRDVNAGRGRHTTKEVILLPYAEGFLFDTAGFSQWDIQDIRPRDLAICFPGYEQYFDHCFFNDCQHVGSPKGCAVLKAVGEGKLSDDSYRNYLKIYEEVRKNDLWKKRKPL